MKSFFKTYLSEMLMIWGSLMLYCLMPFGELVYDLQLGLYYNEGKALEILFYLACMYSVIGIPLFLIKNKEGSEPKLLYLVNSLARKSFDNKAKHIALTFGIKLFFIPLMIPWTVEFAFLIKGMLFDTTKTYSSFILYFNGYLFLLITYLIGFTALVFYSFGYLIESRFLNNKIKSVEPTIFGWAVTLICYPLFITFVLIAIPFYTNDMAFFKNQEITFIIRIFLLLVMTFKIWSIAVLGAKCSNLTNRGIVTKGPYRWVRHPHYLAKLIVWWVTLIPAFALYDFWIVGTMIFWTVIYVLRAFTEENHLLADEDYVAYCSQVKWRFIPYIF
jgi:protein-S-isoprenylcysteine O-methyltransferase Ste14